MSTAIPDVTANSDSGLLVTVVGPHHSYVTVSLGETPDFHNRMLGGVGITGILGFSDAKRYYDTNNFDRMDRLSDCRHFNITLLFRRRGLDGQIRISVGIDKTRDPDTFARLTSGYFDTPGSVYHQQLQDYVIPTLRSSPGALHGFYTIGTAVYRAGILDGLVAKQAAFCRGIGVEHKPTSTDLTHLCDLITNEFLAVSLAKCSSFPAFVSAMCDIGTTGRLAGERLFENQLRKLLG